MLDIAHLDEVRIVKALNSLESSDENSKDKDLSFSPEQRQKAQSLIAFASTLRIHHILLVDNDKAG